VIGADAVAAGALGSAAPLGVRFGRAAAAGETVAVVGYGRTEDAPAGVRRRRDGVHVAGDAPDAGAGASAADRESGEWLGSDGVCDGDSGGPALDSGGLVVGIASRILPSGCGAAIFTGVAASDPSGAWLADAIALYGEPKVTARGGCIVARGDRTVPWGVLACALLPSLLIRLFRRRTLYRG
jgi:hypothetical protein